MEFFGLLCVVNSLIIIIFYVFNFIFKMSKIIEICVCEVIKGFKVEMCCFNLFVYDNVYICFSVSVVKGIDIMCKWYFKKGLGMDYICINRINERINYVFIFVGEINVIVYCYNRLLEDERVIFLV